MKARLALASISPLNCGSAGVPPGMRPSVCTMDTRMEIVLTMMKMTRTSWDVRTLRHICCVGFLVIHAYQHGEML